MSREMETVKRHIIKNRESPIVKEWLEKYQRNLDAQNRTNLANESMFTGPGTLKPLLSGAPELKGLIDMLYNEKFVLGNDAAVDEAFGALPSGVDAFKVAVVKGSLWKERGGALFKEEKYEEARAAYLTSLLEFLEQDESYELPRRTIPNREVQSEALSDTQFGLATMVANNIAQCYVKEGNRVLALDWLEEVHRFYLSVTEVRARPNYPWKDSHAQHEEYLMTRMKAWFRQAQIFEELGNTAAALAAIEAGQNFGKGIMRGFEVISNPSIAKLRQNEKNFSRLANRRHPDPPDAEKYQVLEPDLQVRGAWRMLRVSGEVPHSRREFASAVWKDSYYVFGGEHGMGKLHHDGWSFNLRDPSRGWRKVPGAPTSSVRLIYGQRLAVQGDKGYLFQGNRDIPVFDFQTEKWTKISTKPRDSKWKWTDFVPGGVLLRYTVQVYNDTLYVFGGAKDLTDIGRNALLALDLKTHTWEHLSGSVTLKEGVTLPGVRVYPASWIHDDRLYISLGNANRTGALSEGKPEGADPDFSYRDLWSYDLKGRSGWRQERWLGNTPCLRTEFAYTFNNQWNRAVVFGGYSSSVPWFDGRSPPSVYQFSYFADTFLWNPDTGRWSQALTRGFPTYRAIGDLFTDQETGRTYLFGGYTNTAHTPTGKGDTMIRAFNDLWELTVDGTENFNPADFERSDPLFTSFGPFKKCFNCGSVGRWMVCAGSCKNTDHAAAFCGAECQKAAWSYHKKLNGCRKI